MSNIKVRWLGLSCWKLEAGGSGAKGSPPVGSPPVPGPLCGRLEGRKESQRSKELEGGKGMTRSSLTRQAA